LACCSPAGAHAPPLLQIELAKALVKLARRRKITPAAISDILTDFEALDLVTDRTPPTARTIASMCRRYALSAYGAAYFELAMRLELPLAAKDGPLIEAARKAGIAYA
jgi:predicted nucleic acid-binding protein